MNCDQDTKKQRRYARLLGGGWIPSLYDLFLDETGEYDFSLPEELRRVRVGLTCTAHLTGKYGLTLPPDEKGQAAAQFALDEIGAACGVRLWATLRPLPLANIPKGMSQSRRDVMLIHEWRLEMSGRAGRLMEALERMMQARLIPRYQREAFSVEVARKSREKYLRARRRAAGERALQPKRKGEGKVRWYHVTRRRLPIGTVLVPGFRQNNTWGPKKMVFLSDEDLPHYTMHDSVWEDGDSPWHVYEVEPLGEVGRGDWDDATAPQARVVRYVGTGKGLLNRLHRKAALDSGTETLEGSLVDQRTIRKARQKRKKRR